MNHPPLARGRAHVVVVGNEKGGSGKSTTAMHLIAGLLHGGRRVASLDLDLRQGSLTRYMENRRHYVAESGTSLPMPTHHRCQAADALHTPADPGGDAEPLQRTMEDLMAANDVVVVDTAGSDSHLNRLGTSYADTLVTPLNDSLVDLDVLARVDPKTTRILGPGHYAQMVWEQKMRKAQRDGGSIDWIVMRNRLSSIDAHNKQVVGKLLRELSMRIGFRIAFGFGERVVYRELFLKGLTMMDLREAGGGETLSMSHVAARQEVRTLMEMIGF